jgi:hypothetical protein
MKKGFQDNWRLRRTLRISHACPAYSISLARRIDEVSRLVYRAMDSELVVIFCCFHYDSS